MGMEKTNVINTFFYAKNYVNGISYQIVHGFLRNSLLPREKLAIFTDMHCTNIIFLKTTDADGFNRFHGDRTYDRKKRLFPLSDHIKKHFI